MTAHAAHQGSARAGERGAASLELAILAPVLLALLALIVMGGRFAMASTAITGVAGAAARDASLARNPAAARAVAASAALATLADQNLHCQGAPTVRVDTSGFAAAPGPSPRSVWTWPAWWSSTNWACLACRRPAPSMIGRSARWTRTGQEHFPPRDEGRTHAFGYPARPRRGPGVGLAVGRCHGCGGPSHPGADRGRGSQDPGGEPRRHCRGRGRPRRGDRRRATPGRHQRAGPPRSGSR